MLLFKPGSLPANIEDAPLVPLILPFPQLFAPEMEMFTSSARAHSPVFHQTHYYSVCRYG